MKLEDCSWNAVDVLNVVDGAELVTIVRDIYLCVWYGGGTVEILRHYRPPNDIRNGTSALYRTTNRFRHTKQLTNTSFS